MNKRMKLRSKIASLLLCSLLFGTFGAMQVHATEDEEDAVSVDAIVEEVRLYSADDFMDFAKNCGYDAYSMGKRFILERDIALPDTFDGVPYFSGVFDGQNHSISYQMKHQGADFGLFRYVSSSATVMHLSVSGNLSVTGTKENIGGVVGVNYGTIFDVSMVGTVIGEKVTGGIVGLNKETGVIRDCHSDVKVLGTDETGGICGKNLGVIVSCTNAGEINTELLEATMDIGDTIDVENLSIMQTVISRNNMGGISGLSQGVIENCDNEGMIGYEHTGYNVGGIVGMQSGMVMNCKNNAPVYGRKDVGGIVGQAEPFVEATYLSEHMDSVQTDLGSLMHSVQGISSSIDTSIQQGMNITQSMVDQYQADVATVSANITEIISNVSANNAEMNDYIKRIQKDLDDLNNADLSSYDTSNLDLSDLKLEIDKDDSLSGNLVNPDKVTVSVNATSDNYEAWKKDADATSAQLQSTMNDLQKNMSGLQSLYEEQSKDAGKTIEEQQASLTDALTNGQQYQNVMAFQDNLSNGMSQVQAGFDALHAGENKLVGDIYDNLSVLRGEDQFIADITSYETAKETYGTIVGCVNMGKITSDLNVGGIVGSMSIEYARDPEADFDFSSASVVVRATASDAILDCKNYGVISLKRMSAGGICGVSQLGMIYNCESYNTLLSDNGSQMGGIAGESNSVISHCYSFVTLIGSSALGGIAGLGTEVTDCISITRIEGEGEYHGAVLGQAKDEGSRSNNIFVASNLEGIDGISYIGIAERRTYEDILKIPELPDGYKNVRILFMDKDVLIGDTTVAYGSVLQPADFPAVEGEAMSYGDFDYDGQPVYENLILSMVYTAYDQAIGCTETLDDYKIMLVEGTFYQGTELQLKKNETYPCKDKETLLYAYDWSLSGDLSLNAGESYTCHLYAGDAKSIRVYAYLDTEWKAMDYERDGSYVVVDVPYGKGIAVVSYLSSFERFKPLIIVAGSAAILCFIILGIYAYNNKKSNLSEGKKKKKG
ncbi:MAG: hypothetical protein MJ105_07660 [Lachnospiraceae bacterium]|nr:hypothetical protein [Lachnospiraceae bacterium]